MSNPAVINLSSVTNQKKIECKRFIIEDNIGESIHLHLNDMRIDFTIQEFLEFSNMVRLSLKELDILKKYDISDFDSYFLKECSSFLPKLNSIKIEEISLSDLKFAVHGDFYSTLNLLKITSISNTPAYKYLQGDKEEFEKYKQFNYFNTDNKNRLLKTLKSIEDNGYPLNDKYLILFNGQDIVRDGQHRAAILAHLYGLDFKVKIMRFYFNDKKHLISVHKDNLKSSLLWLLRGIKRRVKKHLLK